MRQFQALGQHGQQNPALYELVGGAPIVPRKGVPKSLLEASGYPAATGVDGNGDVLAPVNQRVERRVFCLGLNYRDHAAEVELAEIEPVVFGKFASVLTGPGGDIAFPQVAGDLDYEAEVALLVGKAGRRIEAGQGEKHITAYFLANDLSSRSLQFGPGGQWTLGKNLDGTTPIGPILGVLEEGETIGGRRLQCSVNEEKRQDADTADMLMPPGAIVEYLSKFFDLRPGDVILTGTPAGTSMGSADIPYLQDGDVVRVECDGLGSLTNVIRREK